MLGVYDADIPDLKALCLEGEDPDADPLGVKGIGEIVQVGVVPAIANAVYNATAAASVNYPSPRRR